MSKIISRWDKLFARVNNNTRVLNLIKKEEILKSARTFFENRRKIAFTTTPTYFDLYKFTGITYSVGTSSPLPAEAYTAELVEGSLYSYTFKYPTVGFPVPANEEPSDYSSGATDWEYQTQIAIVKSTLSFPTMPEWAIDGATISSFLYNRDGSPLEDLEYILQDEGQNLDEITVEFGEYYRWKKLNSDDSIDGFEIEYFAIYPVTEGKETLLDASVWFINPQNYMIRKRG